MDKTKEIIINWDSEFGTIRFKYMLYTDSFREGVHYLEASLYELRGYSKPSGESGGFHVDKSRIEVSILEEDNSSYDNGNLAFRIKHAPDGKYSTVNKEFIANLNQYMFLLEDKFFKDREEAIEYFRNFINECYQAWLKKNRIDLGFIVDDQ